MNVDSVSADSAGHTSQARQALLRHLEASRSRHAGIIRRLRYESGLFLICLVLFSASSIVAGVSGALSIDTLPLLAAAALPSAALLGYGLWLDRHEPEPAWLLLRCLLWGGTVAIFVAGELNSIAFEFADPNTTATIFVPLIEEGLKAAALIWLIRHHRSHINGRLDVLLYALFVGLGFTIVEDLYYYLSSFESDESQAFYTVLIRASTTFLHPLFTAMTGLGLLYGLKSKGVGRVAWPLIGFAAATLAHGLWNDEESQSLAGLWLFITMITGFVLLAQRESQREAMIVSRAIAEFVATRPRSGTEAALTALLGPKPGLGQWLQAARDPGHRSHIDWKLRQLLWLSGSDTAATAVMRLAGNPAVALHDIRREAAVLLGEALDELANRTP